MRATVLEGMELATGVPRHHDRHRAHCGGAIALRLRQFRFEAEEIPGRPAKNSLLLAFKQVTIRIDPVWDSRAPFGRPFPRRQTHRRALHYSSRTLAALITLCQRSTSRRKY